MDAFGSLLKLAASEDLDVSERACKMMILLSTSRSEELMEQIRDVKLIISSLCCSTAIRWGTISSIFFACTNAMSYQPALVAESVIDMLEISRVITSAYLLTPPTESSYRPHLLPLVNAISKALRLNIVKMDINLLLALSDHCTVGFVPNASFVPMMLNKTEEILSEMNHCDASLYPRLCEPISSPDADAKRFYIYLWSILIGKMFDRPVVIHSIARHWKTLLEIIEEETGACVVAAKWLRDCIKASPTERDELAKQTTQRIHDFLGMLIDLQASFVVIQAEQSPKKKEKEEAPKSPTQPPQQQQQQKDVHRTVVEMMKTSKLKKKSVRCNLTVNTEARVLMWPEVGKEIKDTCCMHLTECADVQLVCARAGEGNKTLKVTTKKGSVYMFEFESPITAEIWKDYIKEKGRRFSS